MSETDNPYSDVECAVWRVLGERRWFGKHVDEAEMDQLEDDLRGAIRSALETWVS